MTTAPNSLIPRAHIVMAPLRIPRHDSGSVICQKTCQGLAPSTRATCSSSRLTDWKASRLALISKGRLTNIIPTTIPPSLSVKNKPSSENGFPRIPCLPKTNNKAIPAAVWGIISGRSITPASRDFQGKLPAPLYTIVECRAVHRKLSQWLLQIALTRRISRRPRL